MVHPGRILLEDYLAPRGISVWHLARDIGLSPRRIYEVVQGQRAITSLLAHRLAHYFGLSERYWLDLQARYDMGLEEENKTNNVVDLFKPAKHRSLFPPPRKS